MKYLDTLEQQLVSASRELSCHTITPSGSGKRHTFSRRMALSAAGWLIGVIIVSGAVAEATGLVHFPDLTAPAPNGTAQSIAPQLASNFKVLRRPRAASDAMPAAAAATTGTERGGPGSHWGTNPRLSRRITLPDGSVMYLEPGSQGTCLLFATGGGACGPNQTIAAHGIFVETTPATGGPFTIVGVVPDHATITATTLSGSSHRVRLGVDNTFVLSSTTTKSLVIRTPRQPSYSIGLTTH